MPKHKVNGSAVKLAAALEETIEDAVSIAVKDQFDALREEMKLGRKELIAEVKGIMRPAFAKVGKEMSAMRADMKTMKADIKMLKQGRI